MSKAIGLKLPVDCFCGVWSAEKERIEWNYARGKFYESNGAKQNQKRNIK